MALVCRVAATRAGTLVQVPSLNPVFLSDARILAASIIFVGSYVVFALGKLPWMKIDRPGAAIIGAVLMVAFRVVGAREALASIDFATVVLLFSMMLIVAKANDNFLMPFEAALTDIIRTHHVDCSRRPQPPVYVRCSRAPHPWSRATDYRPDPH